MRKLIALDIGSSAIKACLYKEAETIELLYSCTKSIGLYTPLPGYAEHKAEEVYESVCEAIKTILKETKVLKEEIITLSICSQAQCVLLVDEKGKALTPIYNSQDARAGESFKRYYASGLTVEGINVFKLAKCFLASGFMPGSVKDPIFKYKWVEDNLPEIYKKAYKWLDIKDYIIMRLTGKFVTTKDNAHAYTIYNSRKNDKKWNKAVCDMFKVDEEKLPVIIDSTAIAGYINKQVALETGLIEGMPIIGGVIDSSAVQYGSGAVDVGETMIYWGTSGWVGTVIDKLKVDVTNRCGSLIGVEDGRYNYYAVLDSAGISYRWLKEHIVSDDSILNYKSELSDKEIYKHMNVVLKEIKAGSDGLMYTPWLTGCRAPMEASDIGAVFLNVKRSMGKCHFDRAVIEGICYHYRLLREKAIHNIGDVKKIRFVGGGANSDEIAQILADVLGLIVEVPKHPQDVGALGAAIVGFYALSDKAVSMLDIVRKQNVEKTFYPDKENNDIYNKYYEVYKTIFKQNHKILSRLSEIAG